MAVVPASEHLPSSWECGLRAEVGVIWFSTLVPSDATKDIEIYYHGKLVTACRYLPVFTDKYVERMHKLATMMCSVVKTRNVLREGKLYVMINCVIRVKTFLPCNNEQKKMYLQHMAKNLFRAFGRLVEKELPFLRRHQHFNFRNETGFLLTNKWALRMALRTLCFEVADVPIPRGTTHASYGSKSVIGCTKTFYVENIRHGSNPINPLFTRSMLETEIPKNISKLVLDGVCYCPATRFYTNYDQEAWCMHVHSNEKQDVEETTDSNNAQNPVSLQTLCKFSIIETAFKTRRARSTRNRKSPYYRLKL